MWPKTKTIFSSEPTAAALVESTKVTYVAHIRFMSGEQPENKSCWFLTVCRWMHYDNFEHYAKLQTMIIGRWSSPYVYHSF